MRTASFITRLLKILIYLLLRENIIYSAHGIPITDIHGINKFPILWEWSRYSIKIVAP